ncbi:MAG TPA: HAD family hydrolase [Pirellulales bacterium]|jgi:putative hydrolase of the HAD superfamily
MMKKFSSAITPITTDWVVAFDLDDTLYKEADFVASGFAAVADRLRSAGRDSLLPDLQQFSAQKVSDVFGALIAKHGLADEITKEELLEAYRFHPPQVALAHGAAEALLELRRRGSALCVISDGRSRTQRNKLRALGVEDYFDPIIISEEIGTEKPAEANFRAVMTQHPDKRCVYVADNTAKDFITPRRLGWTTICLRDDGRNIHPQRFDLSPEYLPEYLIESLDELIAEKG